MLPDGSRAICRMYNNSTYFLLRVGHVLLCADRAQQHLTAAGEELDHLL